MKANSKEEEKKKLKEQEEKRLKEEEENENKLIALFPEGTDVLVEKDEKEITDSVKDDAFVVVNN